MAASVPAIYNPQWQWRQWCVHECVFKWVGVLAAVAQPVRKTTHWLDQPGGALGTDLGSVAVCQTGGSQSSGGYQCNLKQLEGYFNPACKD